MALNFRITIPFLSGRIVKGQSFRSQVAALNPFVPISGRVFSTDLNALARLRGSSDVEPVINALLVRAGRTDPAPLQRDLAAEAIPPVIPSWGISKPLVSNPKTPGLCEQQFEGQKCHQMVGHVPGRYVDGVCVYQLADNESSGEDPL